MSRLQYSPSAAYDIKRLGNFLEEADPNWADETSDIIIKAIDILRTNPEVGRPAGGKLRELVISRGRSGYLALYLYNPRSDTITIKAVRHQRESGYHSH